MQSFEKKTLAMDDWETWPGKFRSLRAEVGKEFLTNGQWLTLLNFWGIPYLVGKISRSNGFISGSRTAK